jgi:hypothetical protein
VASSAIAPGRPAGRSSVTAVDHHNPEDFDITEPVRFRFQKGAALFPSCANQGTLILCMWNRRPVVLERNLIQPELVVE